MPTASSPLPAVRFLDQEAVLSLCRQLATSFWSPMPGYWRWASWASWREVGLVPVRTWTSTW